MKAEEATGFVPRPKRPRVVVLGPTKELTEQAGVQDHRHMCVGVGVGVMLQAIMCDTSNVG